jgi:exodeoxyribonuclease VII large subunit
MSEAAAPANTPEYSVSEIASALKRVVENSFPFVRVRGEISGLKAHSSGHIYFDLKDEKAVLNAVIWRNTAAKLKMKPQSGLDVVCTGRVSTYPGSSRYQIIVEQVELAGLGALMAMLEQRKQRLTAEGLFSAERKKALPFLPSVIGVVTSPTGAVIRDIMHRLQARFPRRVLLWPVAVQGERAAAEIAAAIGGFNGLEPGGSLPRPDLLIVARGGGSIEDLMPFNEEIVVRAAAASTIPLIAAVGHETDVTLIDFAADARAPTPTAAAEMAVPVRTELVAQLRDLDQRGLRAISRTLTETRSGVERAAKGLPRAERLFAGPRQRLDLAGERMRNALQRNLQEHRQAFIEASVALRTQTLVAEIVRAGERGNALGNRLEQSFRVRVVRARQDLDGLSRVLDGVSYRAALARGFALVRGADGALKRSASSVSPAESLRIAFRDGEIEAVTQGVARKDSRRRRTGPGPDDQGSLI